MTKAEFISVIKNTLKKVDEQGTYREPLLERHISVVHEQMFNELFSKDRKGLQKYLKAYSDTIAGGDGVLTTGHTLANLPISLPRTSGGLFKVWSTGVATNSFVLTTAQGLDNAIDTNFDTAVIKGKYFASLQIDKLYGNVTIANDDVLHYKILPKFTTLASTDQVPIVLGTEEQMIDRVIDTIQHMPPTDLINDNTVQ